jgi:hypothetical protein
MPKIAAAPKTQAPVQNDLLAALPAAEFQRLSPDLELVPLPLGMAVYESGGRLEYVYFPPTASSRSSTHERRGIGGDRGGGPEGLVGVAAMGGNPRPAGRWCKAPARLPVPSKILKREFEHGGPERCTKLRYTQAPINADGADRGATGTTGGAATVPWLLLSLTGFSDELDDAGIDREHVGVRREGVTEAAGKLQTSGLIQYNRGHIKVLDRPKLEQRVCECYAVVKRESDRLLPHTMAV